MANESSNSTPTTLAEIPLSKIRENPSALRAVNRTGESYLELVESIRKEGVLNPILVREVRDPDSNEMVYGLVDGLHRFSGAQDAGLETIPAKIVAMDDAKVLIAQIMTNVHKVETRPAEYSAQLNRILAWEPLLTLSELAARLGKSPTWVTETLRLVKLDDSIQELVNTGEINLSNAYALAKLPPEEQANFLDRAMTQSPQEFVPAVSARVKELRDAKRQGREAKPAEFQPVAHVRKIAELRELATDKTAAVKVANMLKVSDVDSFILGLQFAVHLDPISVEQQRAADVARK